MITDDGQQAIIFNGEIYNFKDLRKEYLKDCNFKSQTHTETVLYLYEKYGSDALMKFNGDFAFALLDKRMN